jgi:NAD+ synthase (glutamine-hydrolysing)
VLDELGEVLAEGETFAEDFLVVDLELGGVFNRRLHDPRLRKERALDGGAPLPRIVLRPVPPPARPALGRRVGPRVRDAVAEIYDALVLGTRDYIHKNGFREVTLGLSGGIDSALTACIAVDAIGAANVLGVSMPSAHTSAASRDDAAALAARLGVRLVTLPIGDTFDALERTLAPVFAGRPADVTEENLQARIRGTLLMALSNKLGALVLVTGNKSEIAVGYNTLYGDTAGGFAVLKDVYKTEVYRLASHRDALGGGGVIPAFTLSRPPSAELRPDQTDQDSLPPYDVLDPILRAYIEEDRPIAEIVALGFDETLVRRIAHLVAVSEWKRRQMPPGVKVSPRGFGKDWRMPVTDRWRG